MERKRKRLLGIVAAFIGIGLLAGVVVVIYAWNKPHRDIQSEEASVQLDAKALVDAYTLNQAEANTLYLDQVVAVKGVVTEVDENHITLEPGVYCTMEEGFNGAGLTAGQRIMIKGRVVSFDELFGEVRLDKAAIINQ